MFETFVNLEAYHKARPAMLNSVEADYGAHNTDDLDIFPAYARINIRVSHVVATGEWYAFSPLSREHQYVVIGKLDDVGLPENPTHSEEDTAERMVHEHFKDWDEGDGPGRPLSWFLTRIRSFEA